ncbi:hypothetical protein HMI55_007111 [Coelomomyces lativittatus]|nr:hypothetical protein HMI55_007111 [Coelomomyces lativittatus]
MDSLESLFQQLIDTSLDISERLTIARNLKESHDYFYQSNFAHFMKLFFPALFAIFSETSPSFQRGSPVQELRHTCLDILHRSPLTDAFKTYVHPLLELLMQLLEIDNEEIALLCLRILIELNRTFKSACESYVLFHFAHF